MNAHGKEFSIPKRMPIFFIGCDSLGRQCASVIPRRVEEYSCLEDVSAPLDMTATESNCRQVVRQHVAPVVPVMATPLAVVEPVANPFRIENARHAKRFVSRVVPFAGAENDAHVVVLPRVRDVGDVLVGVVKINIVVVIALKEITDIEGAAQTNDVAHLIRMAKGDVERVIRAEAGSAK